jgi:hypothetical protein
LLYLITSFLDDAAELWHESDLHTSTAQYPSGHEEQPHTFEGFDEYFQVEQKQLVFHHDVQCMKRCRYVSDRDITMLSGYKATTLDNQQLHHGAVHPVLQVSVGTLLLLVTVFER